MAIHDIKVLQEQGDGTLKETLLTPVRIGAQSVLSQTAVDLLGSNLTLAAARNARISLASYGGAVNLTLPTTGNNAGDRLTIDSTNQYIAAPVTINHQVSSNPLAFNVLATVTGQQIFTFLNRDGTSANWMLLPVDSHVHSIGEVTALQSALDGKQASGSYATLENAKIPLAQIPTHNHSIAEVVNLTQALNGRAPISHVHAIGDVTNLESTLNAKHGFQPNPDGVVADNVSDILYIDARIPKSSNQEWTLEQGFNGIRFFRDSNTWRLSRWYTDDGFEWYSETATVDAAWPWLATWPFSSVKKYELPRVLPSPLTQTATEGTSQHASRADHTHPYPTPAQIGASASNHTHADATSSQSGFLSPQEKLKISSSLTTAFLDFSGFISTFGGSNPYQYSGKMLQSGIPPVVVGGLRYEAIGFKNGYVYWENSEDFGTRRRELVFAPKQPFHVGVGLLATLSTYIPYASIGSATGGTIVQIEGSAETRRVRQTFSVSPNNYAYVIDFPASGSSSSGPEQLELWTANQVSVSSTLRLLQRVAVLGPTLGFSWQPSIRARSNEPSSGSHRSSFRIISTEYDRETNDFYAHALHARADSDLTASGDRQLFPVWSLSWAGGVTVVRQDAMFALEGPPGSNHALVSRKNLTAKGGLLAWQPKDGRVAFTNTTANSVSSTPASFALHESHVFCWRTSHASGFATGALTMPSALEAEVGQRVLLTTLNNVTAFTLNANGNTIYGATLPSSLSANQTLEWICVVSATWVRIR